MDSILLVVTWQSDCSSAQLESSQEKQWEGALVLLGEVAADASDHRRDELGQAAELSAEVGVSVLGLRGDGLQVVDGSPGHAHRVDGDVWHKGERRVTKAVEMHWTVDEYVATVPCYRANMERSLWGTSPAGFRGGLQRCKWTF